MKIIYLLVTFLHYALAPLANAHIHEHVNNFHNHDSFHSHDNHSHEYMHQDSPLENTEDHEHSLILLEELQVSGGHEVESNSHQTPVLCRASHAFKTIKLTKNLITKFKIFLPNSPPGKFRNLPLLN